MWLDTKLVSSSLLPQFEVTVPSESRPWTLCSAPVEGAQLRHRSSSKTSEDAQVDRYSFEAL